MPDTKLIYSFTPTPNPVTVSIGGDHPHVSQIDLLVMINNRNEAVEVDTITIKIPVGTEDGFTLSSAANLPAPVQGDWSNQWNIAVSGSQITIIPVSASNNALVTTLMFVLPSIAVNQTQGNVPITIAESSPSRSGTDELVKVDADFPVDRFYVEQNGNELNPPVLYDQDQTVLLKWHCTTEGETNYSYKLRTTKGDAWEPDNSYTCKDGNDGVESVKLTQDTTFELDALKPDGVLDGTLSMTVFIAQPSVITYEVNEKYFGGRVVGLHWLAQNAGRCELEVDNQPVENKAPSDTHDYGYVVPVAGGPGPHNARVTAFARTGNMTASEDFASFVVDPLDVIETGAQYLAITPDGAHALGSDTEFLTMIDPQAKTSTSVDDPAYNPMLLPYSPPIISGIAITRDGRLAVASGYGYSDFDDRIPSRRILLMNTPDGTTRDLVRLYDAPSSGSGYYPVFVTITPDQNHVLVTDAYAGTITRLNLSPASVERSISYPNSTRASAITPDGQIALVSVPGALLIIDLSGDWALEPNTIPMPYPYCTDIAISSDGKLALVTGGSSNPLMSVVDIPNRRTLSPIPIGGDSIALTASHDGQPELAVVTNSEGNLTILRVDDLQAKPVHVPIDSGYQPGAIAISRTGGLNDHGVGLIATNQYKVIRFDVDELPWRKNSKGS